MFPASLYPISIDPQALFPGQGKGMAARQGIVEIYPAPLFPLNLFPASVYPKTTGAPLYVAPSPTGWKSTGRRVGVSSDFSVGLRLAGRGDN